MILERKERRMRKNIPHRIEIKLLTKIDMLVAFVVETDYLKR